jgi:HlyD family type I secretion membrane fusion protein
MKRIPYKHGDSRVLQDALAQGRRLSKAGITAMLLLLIGGGGWLGFAPLNGAVVAQGSITVSDHRKKVQHLEGGIIKEIYVQSGDRVKTGQPLLRLEEVQASALVEQLQDQLDAELARTTRLQAMQGQLPRMSFPEGLVQRAATRSKLRAILEQERTLFSIRKRQLDGQVSLLRGEVVQAREEVAGLERQLYSANQTAAYLGEEVGMNEELYNKQFISRARMLALKRSVAEKDEQRGQYQADLAQAKQRVAELELKILGLQDAYTREASDELKLSSQRVLELQERLRPSADLLRRQVVTAPVSGEVVGLEVHTVGGVIAPGETLMEIVPEKQLLVAEAKVRIEDIAHIRENGPVNVQLDAYKQRTTPLVKGKVIYISADSLTDNVNGMQLPYYLVKMELDKTSLQEAGDLQLTPGMPVTVFIQTRGRSGLDYLVEPVTDTVRKAFREY